jgi:hypothetical protein
MAILLQGVFEPQMAVEQCEPDFANCNSDQLSEDARTENKKNAED